MSAEADPDATVPQEAGVVAGVDGTPSSLDAVTWASREALSRDEPLLLVHAFSWPLVRMPAAFSSMGPAGGLRSHADDMLDQAVAAAREAAPGVRVEPRLTVKFPAPLLLDASRTATRVVVGSRGWGRIGGMLVGSTANVVASRAGCPVVVVRRLPGPDRLDDPVVVGIDGSAAGERALAAAVDLAVRYERRLLVVTVSRSSAPSAVEPATSRPGTSVAPWRERYPSLPIEEQTPTGHVAGTLVALTAEAFAIVVGSHGTGGFTGMLLGSVSQSLLHHAECPVMVIPPSAR